MRESLLLLAAVACVSYSAYRDGVWGGVIALLSVVLGYMIGAAALAFAGETFARRDGGDE